MASHRKHGLCKTKEYMIYSKMKDRCCNKNAKDYYLYGGRGIKVCDRWLECFENFYTDMGPKPTPKHTIDRIDNNGDYCPENCRWITQKEQNRNQRTNHILEFNGKKLPLVVWAELLNLERRTLCSRINKLGWSVEKALTTPLKFSKKNNKNSEKEEK